MKTIYVTQAIRHDSTATIARAKTIIVRMRRRKEIDAYTARAAFCAFEEDDSDMEAQIGTVLSHPLVFNGEYWHVIAGFVVGAGALWKDALEEFVDQVRAKNGAIYGEPLPVYERKGLAAHLQRRGFV